MINQAEFKERRHQLCQRIGSKSLVILPASKNKLRNGFGHFYPFRQNSDFYYFTGLEEPDAILLLMPGQLDESILFCHASDPNEAKWVGSWLGPEEAKNQLGVDVAYPLHQFDEKFMTYLESVDEIYFSLGSDEEFDRMIFTTVQKIKKQKHDKRSSGYDFLNLDYFAHEMRLIKSEYEQSLLRKAALISIQGHLQVMHKCRAGIKEYELEGEILREFYRYGSRFPAYTTILASGENGTILHYTANKADIKDGDLLLVDAGAEFDCYASDITRTFPVNHQFSAEQKEIYQLVLDAQKEAIQMIRPGIPWSSLHARVVDVLVEGLIDLGLLEGSKEKIITEKLYQKFFMHQSGHWLGLDCHDVGNYNDNGKDRLLEPGMVFTIEPGLYFSKVHSDVPSKFQSIAIRIEDDILVTDTGCEVITKDLPKEIADIENLWV